MPTLHHTPKSIPTTRNFETIRKNPEKMPYLYSKKIIDRDPHHQDVNGKPTYALR